MDKLDFEVTKCVAFLLGVKPSEVIPDSLVGQTVQEITEMISNARIDEWELFAWSDTISDEVKDAVTPYWIERIARINKTTPKGVALPEKLSYLDNSIDEILSKYMIRHPKVSISNLTARKMLKRDLMQLASSGAQPAHTEVKSRENK